MISVFAYHLKMAYRVCLIVLLICLIIIGTV